MQLPSLRVPFLASVSLGSLLLSCAAQGHATVKPQTPANGANGANGAAKPADDVEGLPPFLLMVPGGAVEVGVDADRFVNAASQTVNQTRPADAAKLSAPKLTEAMRRSASTLGRRTVTVAPYLLGKWNVKCAEYETFVAARRKAGHKMRAPFSWWRYGCEAHYNETLPAINQAFPKMENAPLMYWERHGADLPYALQDKDKKPIHDLPVTDVSWRDANDFAGWLGMRLPAEYEWIRAARGDGTNLWPCTDPKDPTKDNFTDDVLKKLQIFTSREQKLKPTGTAPAAAGPFGHLDMFGQVWQLIGDLGFRPVSGADAFADEWKKLQKDKVGVLLQTPPSWKDEKAIAKGGSYLSAGEPIQLLIDGRAPVLTIDVMQSLGFRLAKSLKPGYDALYSGLRGSYNRQLFALDQDVDLAGQVGTERYELGADGFPTDYQTVSFAPVNWLAKEKNLELTKLLERSQMSPVLIGTLATTAPLLDAKVAAGIYSVLYRKEGLPREVVEAIKQGHRELSVKKPKDDKKDGEKAEGESEGDKGEKKEGKKEAKATWRDLVARFGLTEADIAGKDAADGHVKVIRLDGVDVPTTDDVFLLHNYEGKIVGVLPSTNAKPAVGVPFPSALVVEANDKGKAVAKFRFAVPLLQNNSKRVADFHLNVVLDRAAPTADKPWRLPQ